MSQNLYHYIRNMWLKVYKWSSGKIYNSDSNKFRKPLAKSIPEDRKKNDETWQRIKRLWKTVQKMEYDIIKTGV